VKEGNIFFEKKKQKTFVTMDQNPQSADGYMQILN